MNMFTYMHPFIFAPLKYLISGMRVYSWMRG